MSNFMIFFTEIGEPQPSFTDWATPLCALGYDREKSEAPKGPVLKCYDHHSQDNTQKSYGCSQNQESHEKCQGASTLSWNRIRGEKISKYQVTFRYPFCIWLSQYFVQTMVENSKSVGGMGRRIFNQNEMNEYADASVPEQEEKDDLLKEVPDYERSAKAKAQMETFVKDFNTLVISDKSGSKSKEWFLISSKCC